MPIQRNTANVEDTNNEHAKGKTMNKAKWVRLAAEFQFAAMVVAGDRVATDYHKTGRGINATIAVYRTFTISQLKQSVESALTYQPDNIELIRCPELLDQAGYGRVVAG